MKKISIAIPTYEYNGLGAEVLEYSFNHLRIQGFRDFEVVVSDNSADDRTKDLCERWSDMLDIHYFKNPIRGAAINSNVAIRMCNTPIIKFLCADDYLSESTSLRTIYENFEDTIWMFTSYAHTKDRINHYRFFTPKMNPNILFVNTLGTPSAMTIRNDEEIKDNLFDIHLGYCYDTEFYHRMNLMFGPPKILDYITMFNYVWDASITSSTTQDVINRENEYIARKYGLIK
jgi:glycosyltransferase involved in cell wall biosynthesis